MNSPNSEQESELSSRFVVKDESNTSRFTPSCIKIGGLIAEQAEISVHIEVLPLPDDTHDPS